MNGLMTSRPRRLLSMRALGGLCLLSAVATLSACSTVKKVTEIEPWVKPYERQNLADPIMSTGRDSVSSTYMHHVYQAREGAKGAEGGGGGGCGCN